MACRRCEQGTNDAVYEGIRMPFVKAALRSPRRLSLSIEAGLLARGSTLLSVFPRLASVTFWTIARRLQLRGQLRLQHRSQPNSLLAANLHPQNHDEAPLGHLPTRVKMLSWLVRYLTSHFRCYEARRAVYAACMEKSRHHLKTPRKGACCASGSSRSGA